MREGVLKGENGKKVTCFLFNDLIVRHRTTTTTITASKAGDLLAAGALCLLQLLGIPMLIRNKYKLKKIIHLRNMSVVKHETSFSLNTSDGTTDTTLTARNANDAQAWVRDVRTPSTRTAPLSLLVSSLCFVLHVAVDRTRHCAAGHHQDHRGRATESNPPRGRQVQVGLDSTRDCDGTQA